MIESLMDYFIGFGAGVTGIWLANSFTASEKSTDTEKRKATHRTTKAVFAFLDTFKKGTVQWEVDGVCDACLTIKQVSFYLDHYGQTRHVFVYVYHKRVLSIYYDLETETFTEFIDHEMMLASDEIERFATAFRAFMQGYESATTGQDKAVLLNESFVIPEKESTLRSWHLYIGQIKQEELVTKLNDLADQLQMVPVHTVLLSTEELHWLERLEQTLLPQTLESFCLLEGTAQAKQVDALLATLEEIESKVTEFQQKDQKQKALLFEKNMALLKKC